MRHLKRLLLLLVFSLIFPAQLLAWDKDIVHTLINENAVEQSSLNSLLTSKLNSEFPNGTSETLNGKDIKTWIKEGGRQEDESILPYIGYLTRSSNHFHDPTKVWGEAGWLGSSQSSVLWAQSTANEWSWQKAREYYRLALSGASKTERENYYGKTFRALGQVMHLVADMAVPEHTRNDTHVFAHTIEWWSWQHSKELSTTATAIDISIFQSSSAQGLAPITNLWDTYQSAGYNPSGPVGLAEYSNYNYLSHDTIFKPYEFPGRTNTFLGEPSEHVAEDGTNDNLIYYSGVTTDGLSIPHLAATSYFYSEISQLTQDQFNSLNATLDDNCFKDYASILVPKAISYSAGLLDYFFRANIDLADGGSGQYVIKNNSTEDMEGTFTLYYDDTDGNRHPVQGASWSLSINANGQSAPITFTPPGSPEPKEKGKYILVFLGTLGNENGAVVGKTVQLCGTGGEITISGPDAPSNEDQYTVTGGMEPYAWSIDKGSIDSNGIVTLSGECGEAIIKATDSCGNAAEKNVMMPDGTWKIVSDERTDAYYYFGYCWSYWNYCWVYPDAATRIVYMGRSTHPDYPPFETVTCYSWYWKRDITIYLNCKRVEKWTCQ